MIPSSVGSTTFTSAVGADRLRCRVERRVVSLFDRGRTNGAQYSIALDVQRFDLVVGDAAVVGVMWSIKRRGADAGAILGRNDVRKRAAGATENTTRSARLK